MSKDAWKRYSDQGYRHYRVVEAGFKYNMTDMTAAMGLVQLKKIILMWRERNLINKYYFKELKNLPIKFQTKTSTKIKHAHHLFVFILDSKKHDRSKIINLLNKKGIGATVHYNSLYNTILL